MYFVVSKVPESSITVACSAQTYVIPKSYTMLPMSRCEWDFKISMFDKVLLKEFIGKLVNMLYPLHALAYFHVYIMILFFFDHIMLSNELLRDEV